MRVLLSAYACEPDKGSEPGVGWHWALSIASRGHEVWVLTRDNNRAAIEAANISARNLHFEYFDLPRWQSWWKKGQRGVHLYYLMWQWGAAKRAKRLHQSVCFDLVHHITFAVFRQPSFMWRIGVPFVVGPLGGGERAPFRLRRGFGWRNWVLDLARDMANMAARMDPCVRKMMSSAELIVVKTPQTLDFVPRKARAKTIGGTEVGIEPVEPVNAGPQSTDSQGLRLLYVGRLVYWKGVHLALRAFQRLLECHPESTFTIVGDGPERREWEALAGELGLAGRTSFVGWAGRRALSEHYAASDLMLFPSLHDSGGTVVLEALSHGLPVVCLELGGPGKLVNDTCGRAVKVAGATEKHVVQRLASALVELADSPTQRAGLQVGAFARAQEFVWEAVVDEVYSNLDVGDQAR